MAGAQVGCISVADNINVEAFINKMKEEKYVVEKEQTDNQGNKYVPVHKAN
jgi:hypothetical protein